MSPGTPVQQRSTGAPLSARRAGHPELARPAPAVGEARHINRPALANERVQLQESNRQNCFNVLPPGSTAGAMFVGDTGGDYSGVLPSDGEYVVRVYLMRPAAQLAKAEQAAASHAQSFARAVKGVVHKLGGKRQAFPPE